MKRRTSTTLKPAAAAVLLLSALTRGAMSQDDFVAIPRETAARYRLDFARNFYASTEAEKSARAGYYAGLAELEGLKGRAAASPDNLLRALRLYDASLVEFIRHYTYLYLRAAVDTRDEASGREASDLDAEFTKRTAFLRQELMNVDARAFERFARLRPALGAYRFAVEAARRYRAHTLSLKEEEALAAAEPLAAEWESDLYARLLRRTRFGTVKTRAGELDARRQRAAIAASPERSVREEGFRKLYAGYASQRDLYAFALTSLVMSRDRLARLRGFAGAPDEVFYKSYLTRAEVSALLERVAALAEVYKRYQRLRAEHARRRLGLGEVNIWDVTASAEGGRPPRFTIEEATARIREALAPLGAEYGRELAALLDPANGRMDVAPGPDRRPGGFSKGFPGVTTVFYSGGFEGFYNDVRVLTHESTHAVHRQLMNDGRVPPAYAEGPHYLFESFAIFNELLLPDYLRGREADPARRLYFLEQFFEGKGMTLFTVAQEESLELAIYDGVARGEVSTADDLDALAERVGRRYSIWFDRHGELKMQWITSALFYDDPLYDINYVYGSLLALKYYDLYRRDPVAFMPRYVALMKNGFDAPADVLLKRHLGIDIRDPRLVADAARLLEEKLDLLESEYSK